MRRIDTPLLNKIKEQNQTLYNGNDPRMSIQVSRAKTTVMDSTYWTVETIRTKAGLGDLSIAARRLKPYGRPDRLYNIYVDNGIVKTATREYPDYEEEKWQDQFSLGNGTAVAICLDGYWELYRGKWQQVTSEKPWLFWVNNGRLYTQYWDETDTKLELATGVSKLKAIRGWANVNIMIQDQGVIVGYIKTDGKVYYRNYCRQANSSYLWENETQITQFTGTANTLNLFITNDYRTGFAVEDSNNKMHLFITTRAWAGMAIGKETFSARPNLEIGFIPLQHHSRNGREHFCAVPKLEPSFLYASDYNKFKHIENIDNGEGDYGRRIRAVSKYRIFDLSIDDFKMTDCHDKDYTCVSVEEVGGSQYNWTYELEFTNFNNADCETTLLFNGLFGTNEAGFRFLEFDGEFLPTNLVPVQMPPPIVDEITNNEDKEIIITFDGEVFNVSEQSIEAFTVTSKYFKDTYEDNILEESHNVLSIEKISSTEIKIHLDPFARIRRANEMTIEYDASIGIIEGETTAIESFTEVFTPDIYKLLDPAKRERFTIYPTAKLDFIEAIYNNRYGSDNLIATADCTIDFIPVEDVNP